MPNLTNLGGSVSGEGGKTESKLRAYTIQQSQPSRLIPQLTLVVCPLFGIQTDSVHAFRLLLCTCTFAHAVCQAIPASSTACLQRSLKTNCMNAEWRICRDKRTCCCWAQGVSPALSRELCTLAAVPVLQPAATSAPEWQALFQQWQLWLTRLQQGQPCPRPRHCPCPCPCHCMCPCPGPCPYPCPPRTANKVCSVAWPL